ncbi:MAG: protein-tyrosine kinase, partial [Lachnospiraceae bacterium]
KQAETTGMTASDLQTSTLLTKDYQQLITSRAVLNQVIEDENLDMTYQELLGAVTVNTPVDTRIVEILVSNPDPKMAQDIANSVRTVAADHIQKVMDSQAVNTVDEANLATHPSKPSILKNTVIGGLLGIFLAIGIVVIIFLLDDRIRSVEDIEQYLGLGVLGSIPIMTEEKKKKNTKGNNRYNSSKRGQKVQKSQASGKIEPQRKKEV